MNERMAAAGEERGGAAVSLCSVSTTRDSRREK